MALSTTEILKTLKEKFNALIAPVAAPAAPAAPVVPVTAAAPTEYTLQDGTTKVSITDLNPGGIVTIAGAPAPAGTYTLQDGTVIIVAENGAISTVTPVAAPAAPAAPAAFAGGIEERLAALETQVAALIQSTMSWELAEKARETLVESMDTMTAEMKAQKEVTGTMLQLVEILATEPDGLEDPAKTSKTILKPADVSKEQFAAALFSKKIKTA